ncbi:MAG: hypothetical protein Kow00128_22270 [Deltaproteobacteria bacterium]
MRIAGRIDRIFRSLSARERILLLFCAVAVGLFLAARLVVYPAVAGYRKDLAEIPRKRAVLARYAAVRSGKGELDAVLARASERLAEAEKGLLKGSDPSASGAVLQGILKPMANRPDTRLTSIRTLGPVPRGAYTEVAVQMDLQTTTEGLARLLAEIAREPTRLRVGKLTVNAGIYSMAMANRPDALRVSIVVAGLTAAPPEAAPAGGGGR